MLRLICTKLKPRALTPSHGYMLFSTNTNAPKPTDHPTVSLPRYPYESPTRPAFSASHYLRMDSGDNPDYVLSLFRSHGLTQTQIKNIILKRPVLLVADVDGKLGPNLEFLKSLGFTSSSIAHLVLKYPAMLETDAKNVVEFFRVHGFSEKEIVAMIMKRPQLFSYKDFQPTTDFKASMFCDVLLPVGIGVVPIYLRNDKFQTAEFLRRFLGSNKGILKVLRKCLSIWDRPLDSEIEPSVTMLRSQGVPHSLILRIFMQHPKALLLEPVRIREVTDFVKNLGFNPNTMLFLQAVRVVALMSDSLWEKKFKTYMSFGMSEDDVYLAFKLQPMCMTASVEKIQKMMNFLVNKVNLKPSTVSKHPNMILLSLEKRLIPRCSVLELLLSEQLIEVDSKRVVNVLGMTEEAFNLRIMSKYKEVVPDVIRAHKGEIEFAGFSPPLSL